MIITWTVKFVIYFTVCFSPSLFLPLHTSFPHDLNFTKRSPATILSFSSAPDFPFFYLSHKNCTCCAESNPWSSTCEMQVSTVTIFVACNGEKYLYLADRSIFTLMLIDPPPAVETLCKNNGKPREDEYGVSTGCFVVEISG